MELRRSDPKRGGDFGLFAKAEEREGAGMAALDKRAAGLLRDPTELGLREIPCGEEIEHSLGMILGDVVEMIGNRATDVNRWVVFQLLQQRQNR